MKTLAPLCDKNTGDAAWFDLHGRRESWPDGQRRVRLTPSPAAAQLAGERAGGTAAGITVNPVLGCIPETNVRQMLVKQ